MENENEEIIKQDLSYYLDKDYKKVKTEMMALKTDIKKLADNVESLTTKVDSGSEVSKANTIILHSIQETQVQTNKTLTDVVDALQGKTILGQKDLGALDKVNIVYEWLENNKPKVVTLEDDKKSALKLLTDYFWAFRIITPLIGLGSVAVLIQFIAWIWSLVSPLISK
jgi:hypothetical protein